MTRFDQPILDFIPKLTVTNVTRLFLFLVLFLSIPLTVISIKTSKDIKIWAAPPVLTGRTYCSGLNSYIRLDWAITSGGNQFNIIRDGIAITSTFGFTWTGGPEPYNVSHNWQVGANGSGNSNIVTLTSQYCGPPLPPPPPPPLPTVDIKANGSNGPITIGYNSAATISWGSTNASSCSVNPGGWTGTSGSKSTGRLTSARTYTVSCSGSGGAASKAVIVRVGAPPPPPPPPPPPGPFETLNLEVSATYLAGQLKVRIELGGVTKDIIITPEIKNYSLDLRGANLTTKKEYALVATSNKSLIRKVNFTPAESISSLNIGDLILGDINQDNVIDLKDQLLLLDAITKQDSKGDINVDKVANSIDWAITIANFEKKGD